MLENGQTRTLLSGAQLAVRARLLAARIVVRHGRLRARAVLLPRHARAFFIKPEWQQIVVGYNQTLPSYYYNFFPFYHPYTALFMRELNRSGLDGLLNRRIQTTPQTYYPGNSFDVRTAMPPAR